MCYGVGIKVIHRGMPLNPRVLSRDFAVVASEVRIFAQRSAAAAKEINEQIGSSVAMMQDGAKQAAEVGATMAEVKQAIKQVSDIVDEIAAASEGAKSGNCTDQLERIGHFC
jgi:methyl-accepting chemotaxis protein